MYRRWRDRTSVSHLIRSYVYVSSFVPSTVQRYLIDEDGRILNKYLTICERGIVYIVGEIRVPALIYI